MKRVFEKLRRQTGTLGSSRGLTLVEIMVVITLLAAIMGVIGFNYFGALTSGKKKLARSGIQQVEQLIENQRMLNSSTELPDDLEELTQGPDPLVEDESKIEDPWGNKYIYEKQSSSEYTVYSAGPDGQRGTEDDIKLEDE